MRSGLENSAFAARLRREIEGEVFFDALTRARYATDASIYQIMPVGVAFPKSESDVGVIARLAAEEKVPLIARGGGTSTAGQTVGEGLILDFSKYLHRLTFYDLRSMTCVVQPGMTLNALNAELMQHGVWFPVDIWSGSQATIGGMCGNNAIGMRSLRYGAMRDNVTAIDAVLADGSEALFGEVKDETFETVSAYARRDLTFELLQLGESYESLIRQAAKALPPTAGGYHLPALLPRDGPHNLASLLVGSEGTLALSKRIELKLQPLPRNWALGVCLFPSLRRALAAIADIAALKPSAIDVLDSSLFAEAALNPAHVRTVERYLRDAAGALVIVEFADDNQVENIRQIKVLSDMVAQRGSGARVIEAVGTELQRAVWDARDAALNAQFTAQAGRNLPFLEDCTVPFAEAVNFTDRIGDLLTRNGISYRWHGFAVEGGVSLRPLYSAGGLAGRTRIRALAEEITAAIRSMKGALSAGQGSGLARSEFADVIFGRSATAIFEDVKMLLDPELRLNPGKIVFAPRIDDPMLIRRRSNGTAAAVAASDLAPTLSRAGLLEAAEACNGLGVCRKLEGGGMCPTFRVTRDERHTPRGIANALRVALTGEAGPTALDHPDVEEALRFCVSCKACKSECPMGVDVAHMKIGVLAERAKSRALPLTDRIYAYLPRYAATARRWRWALQARDHVPALARFAEKRIGYAADRPLPRWQGRRFRPNGAFGPREGREVVVFADTFNRHFEPDTVRAALDVLAAAGYRASTLEPADGERPLCCGRTFLDAGLMDEAKVEAELMLAAARPHIERGTPILTLEPACQSALRDDCALVLAAPDASLLAGAVRPFEDFIAAEHQAGRFSPSLRPIEAQALLHGHCHRKALGGLAGIKQALAMIPGLDLREIDTACCGMAGSFGLRPETFEMSLAMGELTLFPAVRAARADTLLIADGFSCRQQIRDATGRSPRHAAIIFKLALNVREPEIL